MQLVRGRTAHDALSCFDAGERIVDWSPKVAASLAAQGADGYEAFFVVWGIFEGPFETVSRDQRRALERALAKPRVAQRSIAGIRSLFSER